MPDRFYHLVPLTVDRRVRYRVVEKASDGSERILEEGVEASGWVRIETDRATTIVALRDFPCLHPKEICVRPVKRLLRYYLWPERGGKVLDLRRRYKGRRKDHYDTGEYGPGGRGVGKTHQMLISFHPGVARPSSGRDLARRANEPLRAFCTPEHYANCGVWGPFQPADPARFPRAEAALRVGLEWVLRLPRQFHWDGMIDWGDTLFVAYEQSGHWQKVAVPKTSWWVRGYDGWLNNDCNISHDIMVHFLRSADDRVYRYWERMVQHIMDVDTIHAAEDPRHIGGGHRHDQQHWGFTLAGYGTAAVEAGEHYLLTGSLRSREMLIKYADWYLIGGGSEWETRIACLVLAWEITGDKKYMDFIRHPSRREDVYGLKLGTPGALDQPHWRTPAVGLGVQFLYRVTGEKQWRDHFLAASRNFLKVNPTSWWGKRLMAQAFLATREEKYLRALQGLLRSESGRTTYGWVRVLVQGRSLKVPDDLAGLSFAELTQLFRRQGYADPRSFFYGGRYWPYALRALAEAGLGEEALIIRTLSPGDDPEQGSRP